MPVDYKIFYKQLQEQVVCQHKLDVDMVELAKKFAFTIYDMNSDGSVDQADLFSLFRDVSNETLL